MVPFLIMRRKSNGISVAAVGKGEKSGSDLQRYCTCGGAFCSYGRRQAVASIGRCAYDTAHSADTGEQRIYYRDHYRCKEAALTKVRKIVVGGESRSASVLAGIREADPASELIAVHDGDRPLVTEEIINAAIEKAAERGAAAPAVPVKDTIKRAVGGIVTGALDRSELYAVQTPQVFEHGLILGALEKALTDGIELTDDCSAVERIGMPVCLTEGSYDNIKLTTPEDLAVAEAILERWGIL